MTTQPTPPQIYCAPLTTPEGQDQVYGFYTLIDVQDENGATIKVRQYGARATVAQLGRMISDAQAKLGMIGMLSAPPA